MGVAGLFDHPLLVSTIDHLVEVCHKHGAVSGIQTRGVAMAKMWAGGGMRFVGAASEHTRLLEKGREVVAALHEAMRASSGQ